MLIHSIGMNKSWAIVDAGAEWSESGKFQPGRLRTDSVGAAPGGGTPSLHCCLDPPPHQTKPAVSILRPISSPQVYPQSTPQRFAHHCSAQTIRKTGKQLSTQCLLTSVLVCIPQCKIAGTNLK